MAQERYRALAGHGAAGTPSRRCGRTPPSAGDGLLDVAIAGLAARPAVTSVIAGATTPEQVRANAAAGAWQLSAADLAALDEVLAAPVA